MRLSVISLRTIERGVWSLGMEREQGMSAHTYKSSHSLGLFLILWHIQVGKLERFVVRV